MALYINGATRLRHSLSWPQAVVLAAIQQLEHPMTHSDIIDATGLSKSSIIRHIQTLTEKGLLLRHKLGGNQPNQYNVNA